MTRSCCSPTTSRAKNTDRSGRFDREALNSPSKRSENNRTTGRPFRSWSRKNPGPKRLTKALSVSAREHLAPSNLALTVAFRFSNGQGTISAAGSSSTSPSAEAIASTSPSAEAAIFSLSHASRLLNLVEQLREDAKALDEALTSVNSGLLDGELQLDEKGCPKQFRSILAADEDGRRLIYALSQPTILRELHSRTAQMTSPLISVTFVGDERGQEFREAFPICWNAPQFSDARIIATTDGIADQLVGCFKPQGEMSLIWDLCVYPDVGERYFNGRKFGEGFEQLYFYTKAEFVGAFERTVELHRSGRDPDGIPRDQLRARRGDGSPARRSPTPRPRASSTESSRDLEPNPLVEAVVAVCLSAEEAFPKPEGGSPLSSPLSERMGLSPREGRAERSAAIPPVVLLQRCLKDGILQLAVVNEVDGSEKILDPVHDDFLTALSFSGSRTLRGDPNTGAARAEVTLRVSASTRRGPSMQRNKRTRDEVEGAAGVVASGSIGREGGEKRSKQAPDLPAEDGSGTASRATLFRQKVVDEDPAQQRPLDLQNFRAAVEDLHRAALNVRDQLQVAAAVVAAKNQVSPEEGDVEQPPKRRGLTSIREEQVGRCFGGRAAKLPAVASDLPELPPAVFSLKRLVDTVGRSVPESVLNSFNFTVLVQVLTASGKLVFGQQRRMFDVRFERELCPTTLCSVEDVQLAYAECAAEQMLRAETVEEAAWKKISMLSDYHGPQLPSWAVPTDLADLADESGAGPKLVFREAVEISGGVGRGDLVLIFYKACRSADDSTVQVTEDPEKRHRLLFYRAAAPEDHTEGREQNPSASTAGMNSSRQGAWFEVVPDRNGFRCSGSSWRFCPMSNAVARMSDHVRCSRVEFDELGEEWEERKGRVFPWCDARELEIRFLSGRDDRWNDASYGAYYRWNECQAFIDGLHPSPTAVSSGHILRHTLLSAYKAHPRVIFDDSEDRDSKDRERKNERDSKSERYIINNLFPGQHPKLAASSACAFHDFISSDEEATNFSAVLANYYERRSSRTLETQKKMKIIRAACAKMKFAPDGRTDVCDNTDSLLDLLLDGKGDWEWTKLPSGELEVVMRFYALVPPSVNPLAAP